MVYNNHLMPPVASGKANGHTVIGFAVELSYIPCAHSLRQKSVYTGPIVMD